MPRHCTRTIRRREERGSVLLITSVTVLVLIGMVALSIDLGYVLSGRGQLKNGIDSAALAGAAGLRSAIEAPGVHTEKVEENIKPLAIQLAAENEVRRFAPVETPDRVTYPDGLKPNPANKIQLSRNDIQHIANTEPPQVVVTHSLKDGMGTIFADIFGFSSIGLSAAATASLVPVEGGAGMISGCWRPLLLPDTYFDQFNDVWVIGNGAEGQRPSPAFPTTGDYYRSRFAGSAYSGSPYVEAVTGSTPRELITSLRDAKDTSFLKVNNGKNLIGQRVAFAPGSYRVIDFANSAEKVPGGLESDPNYLIRNGFCRTFKVGDLVTVYPFAEGSPLYQTFYTTLSDFASNNDILRSCSYCVKSSNYSAPNTHPRIIPVLLCSPFEMVDQTRKTQTQYRVTNFGAFFLESAVGGVLKGYFVREIVVGGVPLAAGNNVADSSLLPASVRLVK